MTGKPGFFSRYAVRLAALLLIFAIYGFARQPRLPDEERQALASRFAFQRAVLPELPAGTGPERRSVRPVHPSLQPIASWISSVGAGVALHDVDGDGLYNDACHVDTRVDLVFVEPVPGTGDRFPFFTLDPGPGRFDRATMAPMGCLPGDFNEDGRTDLLVYYWGRPPLVFLRRAIEGPPAPAAYRTVEIADPAQRWFTNALTSADVDGDGHLDLIAGNYFPDNARILDANDTGREHMHRSMSRSENGGTNRLLLWRRGSGGAEPQVGFADIVNAFDAQTTLSWTLAVGAADLDGDLLPEIYFGNDFGNDRLLHNLSTPGHPRFAVLSGHKGFTTPASKVLGHDSFKGMGVDFADLNGDGLPDIYVSNIAQNWSLEESHFVWVSNGPASRMKAGLAPYEDRSEDLGLARSGWSWDARFDDFDDDGVTEAMQAVGFVRGEKNRWPELHELAMGNDNNMDHPGAWPHFTPGDDLSGHLWNPFFVRAASGRYFDLAHDVPGLGDSHVSRGIAIADVDGDGDLDFAVAHQWEPSTFYLNVGRRSGASLELDLRLPVAGGGSRPAVGAKASLVTADGRRLSAEVDGGSGHSGKRAPMLHFGLGKAGLGKAGLGKSDAGRPLSVNVRWRDGRGAVRSETLRLTPGVHRVLLGDQKGGLT